jgi:hypothetical protein
MRLFVPLFLLGLCLCASRIEALRIPAAARLLSDSLGAAQPTGEMVCAAFSFESV